MKKELIYSKLEKVSSSAPSPTSTKRSQNSDSADQQLLDQTADDSLNHLHTKKRSKSYPLTKVELQLEEMIREKMATVSMLFPATAEEELPGVVGRSPEVPNRAKVSKHTCIELNSYELQCIEEVKNAANEASFYDKTKFPVIGEVPNLIYALNLAELYIR